MIPLLISKKVRGTERVVIERETYPGFGADFC